MEVIMQLIDFIMHIDKHLGVIIQNYGTWTYLFLFLIIFCETGLVVTPFLPGDSLLFVIGALGATGVLDFQLAVILLMIAAVGGNVLNYFIGKTIGNRLLHSKLGIISRIVKREYIEKANLFYEKHGGKAILLSRFLPILRTFAPFVAGIGKMNFMKFFLYNLIGGGVWVLTFLFGGYFFGNIKLVKENFTYVILAIVSVSFIPALLAYIKAKRTNAARKVTLKGEQYD